MARRAVPDPVYDLRRIRKQQRKAPRARLRIMIAGDPLRPIRTISLPAALPTVVSLLAGALLLGAAILACGSWKMSDARSALERRVRAMVQAADAMALNRPRRHAPDDAAAASEHRGSLPPRSGSFPRPASEGTGRFVVHSANNGEEMEIAIDLGSGEMEADSYRRFRHLMRCLHTGAETPIDPRLIDLLYRIAQRTQNRIILVSVSGRPCIRWRDSATTRAAWRPTFASPA